MSLPQASCKEGVDPAAQIIPMHLDIVSTDTDDVAAQPVPIEVSPADLAQLLTCVAEGAEILFTQQGVPVARLSPVPRTTQRRVFGALRGQAIVTACFFFEPLPEAELSAFEGR